MTIALYAGSFDPPTLGHLDLIERGAAHVDTLIVGIGINPHKPGLMPIEERLAILEHECRHLGERIRIEAYRGATVHFARFIGADVLLRGLRTGQDLDNERAIAEVNRLHGFDTLFLLTAGRLAHVSSSVTRQALAAGLPLDGLVSAYTAAALSSYGPSDDFNE